MWLQESFTSSMFHKNFSYLSEVNFQIMKKMRDCLLHELTSFLLAFDKFQIKTSCCLVATFDKRNTQRLISNKMNIA